MSLQGIGEPVPRKIPGDANSDGIIDEGEMVDAQEIARKAEVNNLWAGIKIKGCRGSK